MNGQRTQTRHQSENMNRFIYSAGFHQEKQARTSGSGGHLSHLCYSCSKNNDHLEDLRNWILPILHVETEGCTQLQPKA